MSENHPVFDIESAVFQDSPLATAYYNLRSEGYHHRLALWAAWEAHKTAKVKKGGEQIDLLSVVGLPTTQKDFADVLGVSARTLRRYAEKHPELARMAQDATVNRLLMRYRLPALHALGKSAADPSYQHASDRRTFFTLTGDLVDKVDVTSKGEKVEQPIAYIVENRPHDDT